MSHSLTLLGSVKTDYIVAMKTAHQRGGARIAWLGASDLAEIAAICALDGVIAAVIDPGLTSQRLAGVPVVYDLDLMVQPPDGVLITDMHCSDYSGAVVQNITPKSSQSSWVRGRVICGGACKCGGPSWYVVQTHPHAEANAAAHLERQGYSVYLPRYHKRRRHARRIEFVTAPLFPSYLFVMIDMFAQRWRSIQSTIGVSRLVCSGEEPAVLSAAVNQRIAKPA